MYKYPRIVGFAAVMAIGLSAQAFAGTQLQMAGPGNDATLSTSPAQIELKFSEPVDVKASGVMLVTSKKVVISTGDAKLADGDTTKLIAPLKKKLEPGVYTVDWHVKSTSGSATFGSYTFTLK